jgi:hypothetical protein
MKSISSVMAVLMILSYSRMAIALEGCSVSHQECTYRCIEYYPNGTDCKKSKKECKEVCDDFDVKPSGDTPHVPITSPKESANTPQTVHPPTTTGTPIDITTKPLSPPTAGCANADGSGQPVNCR